VLLGDTIADYIDVGGGVVSAVFDTASLPIGKVLLFEQFPFLYNDL
jgi:hypothetical protein